jgi:hypothetical protein
MKIRYMVTPGKERRECGFVTKWGSIAMFVDNQIRQKINSQKGNYKRKGGRRRKFLFTIFTMHQSSQYIDTARNSSSPEVQDTVASCGASGNCSEDHGIHANHVPEAEDNGENTLPLWTVSTPILSPLVETGYHIIQFRFEDPGGTGGCTSSDGCR